MEGISSVIWLTGEAGDIGGHVLRALRATGRVTVVRDDLSSELRERVVPDTGCGGERPPASRSARGYVEGP